MPIQIIKDIIKVKKTKTKPFKTGFWILILELKIDKTAA